PKNSNPTLPSGSIRENGQPAASPPAGLPRVEKSENAAPANSGLAKPASGITPDCQGAVCNAKPGESADPPKNGQFDIGGRTVAVETRVGGASIPVAQKGGEAITGGAADQSKTGANANPITVAQPNPAVAGDKGKPAVAAPVVSDGLN